MKRLDNDRDRAEILRRLGTITPDSVRLWGKMSANGMICHLSDGFRMASGERRAVAADSSFFMRTIIKRIAFDLPVRIPKNVPTLPEADQERGGTQPIEFERDKAELRSFIQSFSGEDPLAKRVKHSIFGTMTRRQWARWGYAHVDHHLRQFGA